MEAFRIRRGGSERSVPDVSTLHALAAAGDIRPSDEVHTPAGWVPAASLPELRGRLRPEDPWAAWSDVDSVDATSLYKRMVDEPEDLPVEAVTPMGEQLVAIDADPITDEVPLPVAATASGRPSIAGAHGASPASVASPAPIAPASPAARALAAELGAAPTSGPTAPSRRKEPLPLAPGRDAPPRGPTRPAPPPGEVGELIDFPRMRPPPTFDPLVRAQRPPKPPPLVRTSRLAAMVVAGLLAVLLGYAWIRVSAFSRAGMSAVGPTPARSAVQQKALAPPSPLVLIDADLRKSLPATPRDVKEAGDLSDALLVELVQQRIDVVVADGLVTKWIGKKGDEPRIAEVRVQYRSGGDITRELGAIALVVGRYKRFYHLDIPVFDVTDVTAGTVTQIDAEKAEAYYQARMSLEELLSSIAGK